MLHSHCSIDGLALFNVAPGLHQHDRHAHDCLAVIMLTEGEKSYSIERHRFPVHAGQIAIANPGQIHGCEYVNNNPWAHRTWYLSHALLETLSQEAGVQDCTEIVSPVIDCAQTSAVLLQAHVNSQVGNELDREAAVISALTGLIRKHGNKRVRHAESSAHNAATQRVAICIDLLHSRVNQPLNLTLLARHASVGRHQIIRDFQSVLRLTPGEYLRQIRLEHARQMIAEGLPLTQVAMNSGYSDQSHFSRVFRRVYGYTPSDYAAAKQRKYWMAKIE
jgi:AraC-like DNA-binding protein